MLEIRNMICVVAAAVASASFAAGVPLDELHGAFDRALQEFDKALDEQHAEYNAAYLKRLHEIQAELESQGRVRSAVAIFDEIARYEKLKSLPPAPVSDPVELRDAQLQAILRWQQVQYSNETEIVRLSGRYLQALSQSRDGTRDEQIDAERLRVLTSPRVRSALKFTAGSAPDAQTVLAMTNNADLKFRSVKLYPREGEQLANRLNFDLQTAVAEDDSKIHIRKSVNSWAATRSEDGTLTYKTRFSVTARGDSLPPGCRIVATYFSRSLADRERKRENSEAIDLPALDKGATYTVEGRGLTVFRSYASTTSTRGYGGQSAQGQEWLGMIVELLDADSRPLLHRCAPQSIERDMERDAEKTTSR